MNTNEQANRGASLSSSFLLIKCTTVIMKALFSILFSLVISLLNGSQLAHADIQWTLGKQRALDAAPVDVVFAPDGIVSYILTPGEILIYSVPDDRILNRIPVDKTFDRISHSTQTNTLVISSSSGKLLRFIQLETVQKFSIDGLPFRGPSNAPVTIAVFSDYQ